MKARSILLTICVVFAALLALPAAQANSDDHSDRSHHRGANKLVGTWRFSGFAPGVGDFFDYLVFHKDRTLTERVASPVESIGSGVWKAIRSDDADFAATFETFRDNDSDGIFDSRTRVRLTLQLHGDTITGTGTIEFRTLEENTLFAGPFPGATFRATRMKVIRE